MLGGWQLQFGAWERLTPDQQRHVLALVAECGGEWSLNGLVAFRDHPQAIHCAAMVANHVGVAPTRIEWAG